MTDPQEQLSLPGIVRAQARRAVPPAEKAPPTRAATDPVARVLVDVPLAHLDRTFDYAVPEEFGQTAVPGARVKVRFAGQEVSGYVLSRAADTEHAGRLQYLRRVVSAEPVLSAEVAGLVGEVAARYAGTRSDVLRLAIPARHAATEKLPTPPAPAITARPRASAWSAYPAGERFLAALAEGESPRAVWTLGPADAWPDLLADAIVAAAAAGRGSLVCVPDRRDLERLEAALGRQLDPGQYVVLTADLGPARRYAAFLAVSRGAVRIVIGTRAAAFAPVADLGLVALWDDGDDLYAEPRAPYPNTREVLLLRAQRQGTAALLAAHGRSVEAEYLVASGWASPVELPRDLLRERVLVTVAGGSETEQARDPAARSARLPHSVFEAIRAAIGTGPVLVQTPRSGYATRLACEACRTPASCPACQGPLRIPGAQAAPSCTWCGTVAEAWACPVCSGRGLRAPIVGELRTAEELGRAFPGVPVRTSGGDRILAEVPSSPAIVVATPGAEPSVDGGYAAVVLLDSWLLLARSDLRAAEEALRRWLNAAALVGGPSGRVVVVGDPADPTVQALVRWDPAGFARREMAERRSAHLPPASRVATISGPPEVLEAALAAVELPAGAEVLGPVPVEDGERYVIRVPRQFGAGLSAALSALQVQRSARKEAHLHVEIDPAVLL